MISSCLVRSCEEAEQMLELLKAEFAKIGIELNWSKTKILSNYISRPNLNDVSFTSIVNICLRSCARVMPIVFLAAM